MKSLLSKTQLNVLIKLFVPFIVTRLLLLWVAWFSPYFAPSTSYPTPQVAEQGFVYTHIRIIDVWARWDSGWYLSIVKNGYQASSDSHGQNNLAFFPLFPLLIKMAVSVVPAFFRSDLLIIVAGILISNLCLLGSLWLLYQLTLKIYQNSQVAENSLWFLLMFPASFIFSCFYTDSLFLFLSLGCVYLLMEKKYWLMGLAGFLAALTRSQGVFLVFPILYELWLLRKKLLIHKSDALQLFLASLLTVLGALAFYIYCQFAWGNFFAPMAAQTAWGRFLTWPWHSIISPKSFVGFVTPVDKWITVICLVTSLYSFKVLKNKGLAAYALVSLLLPLTTGVVQSMTRYATVAFPLFIIWSHLASRLKLGKEIIWLGLFTVQLMLFIAWCQFYWAV